MILNIKTSFPKRFSALRDAANKGKGISQLPYWEVSSDDDAATAADADSAYGILTEEPEKPDKTSDKLDLGTVDESSAQDKLRATDNGVSASQDNPTASVPSPNPADSQTFKAGRPTSTSGRGTSVIENSMPDTTVAPRIDTEAQDRGSPPGNGSDTRGSQDDVISPVLDRADDEEGDLIDYEDGDEPAIQDSTGSSTLAGDDAAEAANGIKEIPSDPCCRPHICYCTLCNHLSTADYALDSENDPVTTSNAIERTENISDNITTEIGETHHFADEGLRARDNDPSFQIDEFQHADYDDKDSERYGRVDGDQLGSDNSNAKQSEYLPQSDFKQVLDDSAGLGSNAHYQDDAEDTADISNTGDPRDEGPIEEAEQESHDARELLYEGEPNAEEVETTSQPQQALFDGHDETLNGHETTREYLGETADDFLSRSRVRIAIPEDQLDPYSVAFASTADTDEISYEEDEIFDVVSDQEGEDNLDSKPPSPAKPTSTKRSRGEDEETGVPDDGSQGTFHVSPDS